MGTFFTSFTAVQIVIALVIVATCAIARRKIAGLMARVLHALAAVLSVSWEWVCNLFGIAKFVGLVLIALAIRMFRKSIERGDVVIDVVAE